MLTYLRRSALASFALAAITASSALAFHPGAAGAATLPVTLTWSQQTPAAAPPPLDTAAMVYDPATQTSIFFGGFINATGQDADATWSWNGTTWTELHPANSPSPRYGQAMAYDPATQDIVLFGGAQSGANCLPDTSCYLNDTWTWDGTDWTQQTPTTSPPADYGSSLFQDPTADGLILFGGEDGSTQNNQTWSWNGTTWTQLAPATSPSPRYAAATTYDAQLGQSVLFGGWDLVNSVAFDDTWTWNGTTWIQVNTPVSPSGHSFTGMGYDPVLGLAVLFGGGSTTGQLNDTWIFNGVWTELTSVTPAPPARTALTLTYDPARDDLVMFGGYGATGDLADTWTALLQVPQPVTFTSTPPSRPTKGGTYALSATGGGSDNPITYSVDPSSGPGVCQVSGTTVDFIGVGLCQIDANQAGNNSYFAGSANQAFSVVLPATPAPLVKSAVGPATTVARTPLSIQAAAAPAKATTDPTDPTTTVAHPADPPATALDTATPAVAAPAASSALAFTGTDTAPLVALAAALIATGTTAVVGARRMRHPAR